MFKFRLEVCVNMGTKLINVIALVSFDLGFGDCSSRTSGSNKVSLIVMLFLFLTSL